jgi:hypothetical protein
MLPHAPKPTHVHIDTRKLTFGSKEDGLFAFVVGSTNHAVAVAGKQTTTSTSTSTNRGAIQDVVNGIFGTVQEIFQKRVAITSVLTGM